MPQFKNNVSYEGNKEQLERFAEELIKAGREIDPSPFWGVMQPDHTHVLVYTNYPFGFYNHPGAPLDKFIIYPPDQYAEALKAATEPA